MPESEEDDDEVVVVAADNVAPVFRAGSHSSGSPVLGFEVPRRKGTSPLWKHVQPIPRQVPRDGSCSEKNAPNCRCRVDGCPKPLFYVHVNQNKSPILRHVEQHFNANHSQLLQTLTQSAAVKQPSKRKIGDLFADQVTRKEEATQAQKIEAAREAIVEFYINCSQRISKSTLVSPSFRRLVSKLCSVSPHKAQHLNVSNKWLGNQTKRRHQHFKDLFKAYVKKCMKTSFGNAFAQGIHDGVTLKSGQKYLAVGLSFVNHTQTKNYTVCLGFVPIVSGKSAAVAKTLNELTEDVCGYKYKDIVHSTMSDFAALKVADEFGHEREGVWSCE